MPKTIEYRLLDCDRGGIRFEYRDSKKYPNDFYWVAMRGAHGINVEGERDTSFFKPTRHMFKSIENLPRATLNLIYDDITEQTHPKFDPAKTKKEKLFIADVLGFNR